MSRCFKIRDGFEKKDENFIQIVAGIEGVHYEYDEIKEEYNALEGFAAAKKNANIGTIAIRVPENEEFVREIP